MITLSRVRQATAEFIKVLRFGKKDIKTAAPILPAGIDSKPVNGDVALHGNTTNDTETVCFGYIRESVKTAEGETCVYSTNQAGKRVLEFYMRRDGVAELGGNGDNLTSFDDLKKGFDQLKADFNAHTHAATVGTTGPPSTPSSATIDNCVINYLLVK